jgi:peptide/nickel transport system substrate-binding protein
MVRELRWQLLALLGAAALFTVTLVSRPANDSGPALATTPVAVAAQTALTPTQTPGAVVQPEAANGELASFREGLVGSVQRLNPLLAEENPAERDITTLIFEGLTRTNQYGEPVPLLAKSWVIAANRLEYIVTLREDVLWQDGIPFSADDVAFTMSLLRDADFPGSDELGTFWRTVETEQLGPHLVRFRLTQPLGSFLDKLQIGILPEHALRGTPASALLTHPFNLSPIGTGPYQLEALRSADSQSINQVDLRVAPVYRQRPEGQTGYTIDRLSFVLLPTIEAALVELRQQRIDGLATRNRYERQSLLLTADPNVYDTHTALDNTLGVLIFNWQRPETRFFREQRVRLALETGMDRTSVLERWLLNSAVQANSPLWPGSWAYVADLRWPPSDINGARFLLETANRRLERNEDAESEATPSPYMLSFDILTRDDASLVNMLHEVAAQWSQIGVNAQVEPEDETAYQRRLAAGDFDMALVELSLGTSADPDVYTFWHQGQYPDGLNYGGVDDTRISEILERARRDPSGINRAILYADFQQTFVDRAIAIPMYYPLFTYATASDVSGVQLAFIGQPADRFRTLADWQR